MTAPYASYEYTKAIMGVVQATNGGTSINEDKLMSNLRVVSRRVDALFHSRRPLFLPYKETRKFPLDPQRVNSTLGTFEMDDYLLALTSLTVAGNAVTNVEAYPDSTMPPFNLLRLTDCCTGWYGFCSDCNTPQQVAVDGIWGFSSDYANAWLAVDALAAAIVSTSATTFTVADADGDDAYGQPYRISAGHLLKVDDEYMEVVSVNTSTNVVTVVRGANGTTAATHLISAPVYRWEVMPELRYAVAKQAAFIYSKFGAYVSTEIQVMGTIHYPSDWLNEVLGTLQAYANG